MVKAWVYIGRLDVQDSNVGEGMLDYTDITSMHPLNAEHGFKTQEHGCKTHHSCDREYVKDKMWQTLT